MEYEDIVSLVAVVLLCLYLVLKCLSSRCGESGDPQADETPNSTSSAADGGRTTTPASHGDMISMNRGGGGRRTTPAASLHSTADRGNGAGRTTSTTTTTTTSHGDHDIDNEGLDRGVLARMPTFDIDEETKQRDACSVCLMEMEEGEKARLLLPCFHCFHVDCIDMWLHSHTTCPLCRSLVGYLDV